MSSETELKKTLHRTVLNAVARIEATNEAEIRRCLFQEYKEWLGENIYDEVLYLPSEWNIYNPQDNSK